MNWIVDGVEAYLADRSSRQMRPWTETGLSFEVVDGRVYVTHTMKYGINTVHRITAPADDIFDERVWQLKGITEQLVALCESDEGINPDLLRRLQEQQSELEAILDQIESLTAEVSESEPDTDSDEKKEPEDDELSDFFTEVQTAEEANETLEEHLRGVY